MCRRDTPSTGVPARRRPKRARRPRRRNTRTAGRGAPASGRRGRVATSPTASAPRASQETIWKITCPSIPPASNNSEPCRWRKEANVVAIRIQTRIETAKKHAPRDDGDGSGWLSDSRHRCDHGLRAKGGRGHRGCARLGKRFGVLENTKRLTLLRRAGRPGAAKEGRPAQPQGHKFQAEQGRGRAGKAPRSR